MPAWQWERIMSYLAEGWDAYRYYDMDKVIASALELADREFAGEI